MTRIGVVGLVLVLLGFTSSAPHAEELDVKELVRRAEDALRGNTSEMKLRMTITTPRWTRELVIRSWDDQLGDRSFSRVLEPPKDKGTGFLRDHDAFWTWLPKVERAMRIPPSMMLQPWMGSDFTNDDLARESSLQKDYEPKLLDEKAIDGVAALGIELTPLPEAPVVWARMELWIEKERLAPILFVYYDEPEPGRFEAIRELRFSDVRTVAGRPLPHLWLMLPNDKPGHSTRVVLEEAAFDVKLDDAIFTQKNLRQSEAAR
ncbi:MAG: outer membrane lipoprotein-sorting protein [Myxococcota bacterium]